jgi:hypothetical protein
MFDAVGVQLVANVNGALSFEFAFYNGKILIFRIPIPRLVLGDTFEISAKGRLDLTVQN